jgi:ATP-dependent Lon protease
VLIPQENEKDLVEIPDNVKKALEIVSVRTVDEVLGRSLVRAVTPIDWPDNDDAERRPVAPAEPGHAPLVTH